MSVTLFVLEGQVNCAHLTGHPDAPCRWQYRLMQLLKSKVHMVAWLLVLILLPSWSPVHMCRFASYYYQKLDDDLYQTKAPGLTFSLFRCEEVGSLWIGWWWSMHWWWFYSMVCVFSCKLRRPYAVCTSWMLKKDKTSNVICHNV